ncbi:MAG: hypothetical protein ABR915_09265 [Thermoguttaceae bacterium]
MNDPETRLNPFSASRIRPRAATFLFPAGQNVEDLVDRLRRSRWRGQIVGPHGSGKSTLLFAILSALQRAGQSTLSTTLHRGQRRLPHGFLAAARRREKRDSPHLCEAPSGPFRQMGTVPFFLVAIDGYEQLGLASRLLLGWSCRRLRLGLLVTSHRSAGLPDLCRTAIDPQLAWRVVERLQAGFPPLVAFEDVAPRLTRHGGDLRETLFDLYDVYADRRNRSG